VEDDDDDDDELLTELKLSASHAMRRKFLTKQNTTKISLETGICLAFSAAMSQIASASARQIQQRQNTQQAYEAVSS
jgi:hypothetical protein